MLQFISFCVTTEFVCALRVSFFFVVVCNLRIFPIETVNLTFVFRCSVIDIKMVNFWIENIVQGA